MSEIYNPQVLFGQGLRNLREKRKLSQEKLADKAGLDRTYISSCERGKRNVSLSTICLIAKALNLAPYELLMGLDK